MKFRMLIALACTSLALSACVADAYHGADRDYYYSGNNAYGRTVEPN